MNLNEGEKMEDVYVVYSMKDRFYEEGQDIEFHGCFSSEFRADAFIARKHKEYAAAKMVHSTLVYVSKLPEGVRWSRDQASCYIEYMSQFIGRYKEDLLKIDLSTPRCSDFNVKKIQMEE